MISPILEIKNVTVGYDGRTVLKDCSFSARSGEITLILGHNGAGKTTLLNSIDGTLPIDAGHVAFKGRRTWDSTEFAYLPQRENVFLKKSLRENLNISLLGSFTSTFKETEKELIEFLDSYFPDLSGKLDDNVGTFSGGMMQMSALARVLLVPKASMLLLDEPTLGLTNSQGKLVMSILRNFAKHKDMGIILVEHNLDIALDVADHVLILKRGEIVFDEYPSRKLSLADIKQYYF